MRCIRILLCFMLLTSVLGTEIMAEESKPASKVVKVGYLEGYGMFNDKNTPEDNGYGFDYLKEIAKYTGWRYEFHAYEWEEALQKLKIGEIDILGPLQKTEERKQDFGFTEKEMGYEYGVLYALDKSPLAYEDWEQFDGMRIGTTIDNYYNQPLQEYLQKHNISAKLIYTDSAKFKNELENDQYDAIVAGSLYDIPDTKIIGKMCTVPYYFATAKGNTEILNGLNDALDKILLEDAYFAGKLQDKYYKDKPISNPLFTSEEYAVIQKYPTLRVSYDSNWSLIQYEKDGQASGISIDILKEISQNAGISFEFVMQEKYFLNADKNNITDADLYINLHLDNSIDLVHTNPYFEAPMLLVGTKSVNLRENLEVGCLIDSSDSAKKLQLKYPKLKMVEYSSANELMNSMLKSECDLAFITSYTFDELSRKFNSQDFVTIYTDFPYKLDIGINKELDPALLSLLNKSIAKINSDQINNIIFSNLLDSSYQVSIKQFIKENAIFIIQIVIICSVFILFILLKSTSRTKNKLETIAYVDNISKVLTQVKFNMDAQELLKNALPNEYMLISMDVDRFKYINDTYGYETGNTVLVSIGEKLKEVKSNLLISRVYADNFLILCRSIAIEQIQESYLNRTVKYQIMPAISDQFKLNFSIGCYYITDPSLDITTMTDNANFARSTLKDNINLNIAAFTLEMDDLLRRQKDILMNMESALEHKEFVVYLQPKYRLSDHSPSGAEALVRWMSPKLGFIAPNDFIPLFEKNGFISKLDFYVFEHICTLLKKWTDSEKHKNYYSGSSIISVNLSEYSLMQHNHIENMIALVEKYNLPANLFEIELTESFRIENILYVQEKMLQLKSAGFHISIDDFGSGYSSLNLLKDLPADILKIDKAFLDKGADTEKGLKIIANVIQMAKGLNIQVVAEGVETLDQVEYLSGMGCDIAQGYYFAKPMPISEFEERYPE